MRPDYINNYYIYIHICMYIYIIVCVYVHLFSIKQTAKELGPPIRMQHTTSETGGAAMACLDDDLKALNPNRKP